MPMAPMLFVTGLFLINPSFKWRTQIFLEKTYETKSEKCTLEVVYSLSIRMPLTPFDPDSETKLSPEMRWASQIYPKRAPSNFDPPPPEPPPITRLPGYFLQDVELWYAKSPAP